MPNYAPVTKQDLLQRLKEQREASRQREADILGRIKSLEARKKYVGELKTWMERRKLTATDLLAMYRELMPKRAERPVKSKNPLQPPTRKSAGQQLVDAMREKRMVEIDAAGARELIVSLGFKRSSYSHIINNAMGAGLLRRGERAKDSNGYMYVVTGGVAPPKAAHGNTGRIVPNRTVKLLGHGDPAFCKAVREARIAKGWTAIEMGAKLDVSGASISNWESGRYTPKEDARKAVLKLLDLPGELGKEATAAAASRAAGHAKTANGQAPLL